VFGLCEAATVILEFKAANRLLPPCNRTSTPTKWSNDYFKNLVNFEWEVHQGPGGKSQWRVVGAVAPTAPVADPSSSATQDIMMLTTDIALKVDPEYEKYVKEFAANITAFEEAFAKAWYKLITRDMGPVDRCVGPNLPPAQDFQYPLPDPPTQLVSMYNVRLDLNNLMDKSGNDAEFLRLAFQCASTFRATDYQGGCNGARIRFHLDWEINAGLNKTLAQLQPIMDKRGKKGLTWADLIVLAGNVAAERAGSPSLTFCPGRSDALDGSGWDNLKYKIDKAPATVYDMMELYERRGQTAQEFVALTFPQFKSSAGLRSALISPSAEEDIQMQGLQYNPELRQWAEYYASAGDEEYGNDFAKAWTRLMNADRFDGPVQRVCKAYR
jgi:catalase-peroxidase